MAVNLKNLIDIDLLSYFKAKLDLLFSGKVDKENGKGLSSNDYTSAEKTKLSGVATGAQVNVLEGIQKNGQTVTISNKIANISVPVSVGDLSDGADYATKVYVDTNGGKIDKIKVNGTEQTISSTDKSVNISVPTSLTDLTNDGNYVADANYVHTDNNYTSTEKTKLSGIATGAQANVLEGIQVNGNNIQPTNKTVDISVPTKLTDLTNDGNFVTDANYTHTDNNYTSTEKTKLSGIANGAQVNVLESVKVNGVAQTITGKAVDIAVPTKTSDITNDSGFITISDVPDGAAASTATPLMDGTADVGTSNAFARGDHVHPSDNTKVDKVTGKGLSTEDYTTTEKNKLSGIATGAQVNVLEGVNVNGNAQTVTSKAVNLIIPGVSSGTNLSSTTASIGAVAVLSDGNSGGNTDIVIPAPYDGTTVTGDAAYIPAAYFNTSMQGALQTVDSALLLKADASSVYTKTEIDQKLVGAMNYKGTVATVANLPSSGVSSGDVYHVTSDGSERAWNGSVWEELGTAVDLSGYVESSDLGLATNAEIDALFE